MKVLSILILGLVFSACGKDSDSVAPAASTSLDGQGYAVVDAGTLVHGESEVTGTGSMVFLDPIQDAGASYLLEFTIDDGGSLGLVVNAAAELKNGIALTIKRQGAKVQADVAKGETKVDISAAFEAIDGSGVISLLVDGHNDEDPMHMLVWPGESTEFGEELALYNSEEDGNVPGQGAGKLWGIVMSGAQLKTASAAAAKFED